MSSTTDIRKRRTPQSSASTPSATPAYGSAAKKLRTPIVMATRSKWIVLALASGACAAFNGVFAKLTTTDLTTSIASSIASAFHFAPDNKIVEFLVRGTFFLLNLLFNAIMWYLFTRALTSHTSTTQVSIVNTSANFMLTALLGAIIFSEKLPGLWWVGAGLLVVGNVIVGRRDEGDKKKNGGGLGAGVGGSEGLVVGGGGGAAASGGIEGVEREELLGLGGDGEVRESLELRGEARRTREGVLVNT
ncbi:hypothetical protein MMC25_003548 [Agyrium rufum]|nr:hypothetical protein [Agyrium rufum]